MKRVLVVDDEVAIRKVIGRTVLTPLKEQGLIDEIKYASHGGEAYGIIQSSPDEYVAIITDQAMPVMGGRELLEKVSFLYERRGKAISMIMVSGTLENVRAPRPDVRYVAKPFDTEELRTIVAEEIRKGT